MGKHANGYLTPTIGAGQGVFRRNMWLIRNQRKECSTALRGMLRTALAHREGRRFQAAGCRAFSADCRPRSATADPLHRKAALHEGTPHIQATYLKPDTCSLMPLSYFSSTEAPASSSCAWSASASSRLRASLTGFGASSTRAFASLRPRPVAARTTLMTWIFFSPGPWSTTSNSVCSSSGAAAPSPVVPAAGVAATAVAETPKRSSNAFTSSESSRTVMFSIVSINSSWFTAIASPPRLDSCLRLFGALLLLDDLAERHDQSLDGVVEHRD